MVSATATPSIETALRDFLAEQRARLSDATFRNYEAILDLLASSLDSYAYDTLSELEGRRWRAAFDAGDEEAYCHLFGPDKIPEHLGGFLGWFMIRKVIAGQDLLRAAGPATKRLVEWLARRGYIEETRDQNFAWGPCLICPQILVFAGAAAGAATA